MIYRIYSWFIVSCMALSFLIAPSFAYAAGAHDVVSFKPTPGDLSITFLENIFGVVDGVLAGSGSQIVGAMFGVFNAAVIFIGGMILLYMLMVSTLNMSNDGQLVGQKWSTMWIPFRSTLGVGLLLPQSSGYCVIQIFIMFVVVHGVGAADSIWTKTLSYLNRGGVIIQRQMSQSTSVGADNGAIMNAAMGILAGQVCMQALNVKYQNLQTEEWKPGGTCQTLPSSDTSSNWYKFCSTQVPNFIDTVDILTSENLVSGYANDVDTATGDLASDLDNANEQYNTALLNYTANPTPANTQALNDAEYIRDRTQQAYDIAVSIDTAHVNPGQTITQEMPYFGDPVSNPDNIYTQLNGICGKLSWTVFQSSNPDQTLTSSEQETMSNSRTIAVSQMYDSMKIVANAMITNAPTFNASLTCEQVGNENSCRDIVYGQYFFGYPMTQDFNSACRGGRNVSYDNVMACKAWGVTDQTAVLFYGRELQDAVAVYNGIMLPTISSQTLNAAATQKGYEQRRSFITDAENEGWIMAGAYFFRLALLNNYLIDKVSGGNSVDSNSGLVFCGGQAASCSSTSGQWSFQPIKNTLYVNNQSATCPLTNTTAATEPLCQLSSTTLDIVGNFITGAGNQAQNVPTYNDTLNNQPPTRPFNSRNLTVYTFLINENSVVLPEQVTALNAGLNDSNITEFNPDQSVSKLDKMSFSSGKWGISGAVAGFLWNDVMRPVWNMVLELIMPPIMELFSMMLSPIISMSADIFNKALDAMRLEGMNPIIAIAEMGVQFIDGVGNSWISILLYTAPASIFPPAFSLIMMLMPIVTAWMGIMLTVGFSAAFYVPFVPVLVFTFAAIAWLIAIMEGMVAAPIVALGVMHPEGDNDAFGKSDQAWMLILNMFLRPSLMIIGYVMGIAFSYVGVWVLNAGFNMTLRDITYLTPIDNNNIVPEITTNKEKTMYGFWTNIMLFYFSILTYASLYVSIAQQAFEMIHYLPDKILRWLSGGQAEQLGEGVTKPMLQQVKAAADDAGSQSSQAVGKAQSGINKSLTGGKMDPDADHAGGSNEKSNAK